MRSPTEDASTSFQSKSRAGPPATFLAAPFLRVAGLVALVALAAEVVWMPRLVALDAALWRAALFARGCGTDHVVERVLVVGTRMVMVLLAAVAVLSARRAGVHATWPPLAVCAIGLLAGRVMKDVFMRDRPSGLPDATLGHSFPSAHVMNTALAALAVLVLATGFRHRGRWWSAATILLAMVAAGRLLLGRHWLLDVVGGVLAAGALMGLCLPAFRQRPLLAPAVLALALTAVLASEQYVRASRIRLPTPLSSGATHMPGVDAATLLGASTSGGDWEATSERAAGRGVAWMRGAATVTIEPPAETSNLDTGAELTFAGRPDVDGDTCAVLRLAVNGRPLAPFVPFEGWREYRLPLPAGTLRPGANEVQIEVTDAGNAPWRFALVYLRLVTGARP